MHATLLLDDPEDAERRFTDAAEPTDAMARPPLATAALAYRAVLARGRGDRHTADLLVERALSVARRGYTGSHVTTVLAYAPAARLLSRALPWYAVGALLEIAEVEELRRRLTTLPATGPTSTLTRPSSASPRSW